MTTLVTVAASVHALRPGVEPGPPITEENTMTAPAMDEWLAERIAGYLSIPVDDVDHDRSLADYGLDSVYALSLCGEIEEAFGLVVEPTLAYDHPTVVAMTEYLNALRGRA